LGLGDWFSNKVIICVGSGGVGKTTVSASLGVLAAKQSKKVLIMTIDPSQRLRSALGFQPNAPASQIIRVPGQNFSGELHATWLDASQIFNDFIRAAAQDDESSQRLIKNRLYQQLSTTLSGSQEFTSLLQLAKVVDQMDYDLVILDTPPAQHAIDFLEAPEKLHQLFQESVVRWFVESESERGIVRKILAKGTVTVLGALQRITGSDFMTELSEFFKSVSAVQGRITRKTVEVRELLRRDTTRFLLVTAFDQAKLREAHLLRQYLQNEGYRLEGVLLNRAFPKWFQTQVDGQSWPVPMTIAHHQWREFFKDRNTSFQNFMKEWQTDMRVLSLPDLGTDISGLKSLEVMANELVTADEKI